MTVASIKAYNRVTTTGLFMALRKERSRKAFVCQRMARKCVCVCMFIGVYVKKKVLG